MKKREPESVDKEFCLLDERWVKVLNTNNEIKEVSLIDVFQNAHLYQRLAGETVTQDAAIFRVLLSIVITVFFRYDEKGTEDNVLDYEVPEEEILDRWEKYWKKGCFSGETFRKYLEKYRERFYLFHPETPFWQVANPEQGTDYETINLFGNIKESNNKKAMHHFHMTDGKYISELTYSETARWLIYNNAYSVNVKTKINGENRPAGVGRLGQIGLILADADNLFQMLMLNLCALRVGEEAWGEPKPIWENDVRKEPGVEIPFPNNLPELYTIQSRRLYLKRKGSKIAGFRSIGGDYYSSDVNNITEPMTLLEQRRGKNKDEITIVPKKIKKEVMAWREFPSLLTSAEKEKSGLVLWLERLIEEKFIDSKSIITFQMIGLEYGDGMSYTNGDLIEQSLSMSKGLLNKAGLEWVTIIISQIRKCEQVANMAYGLFSQQMVDIIFGKQVDGKNRRQEQERIRSCLTEQYYFNVDRTFKEWLLSIDPESIYRDEKEEEWERQSRMIAEQAVENYVAGLRPQYLIQAAGAVKNLKTGMKKIYHERKKEK